ncbi:MAG: HD-GYP domain-containing protein, partial [Bacillota bacterium]
SVQLSMALGYAVKMSTEENLMQTIKEAEKWMYHRKLLEGKSYRHSIINALLTTLAAKSMETEEHAARLKKHCLAVGRALGLAARELDELALFAVLHDIGKVGIKESILQKQGPLTREEWEEMKKHPEVGYRITQNATELASVAEYILYHHERWDGQGYPRGLRGEEIPLLCRILAVADAYDAMTSNRPYRRAMSRAEAVAEIARNRGTQFDPRVVDVFLRYLAAVQDEPAGAGS